MAQRNKQWEAIGENWLGHLLHLDTETEAIKALDAYLKQCEWLPGRPKETWLSYSRQILLNGGTNVNAKSVVIDLVMGKIISII